MVYVFQCTQDNGLRLLKVQEELISCRPIKDSINVLDDHSNCVKQILGIAVNVDLEIIGIKVIFTMPKHAIEIR